MLHNNTNKCDGKLTHSSANRDTYSQPAKRLANSVLQEETSQKKRRTDRKFTFEYESLPFSPIVDTEDSFFDDLALTCTEKTHDIDVNIPKKKSNFEEYLDSNSVDPFDNLSPCLFDSPDISHAPLPENNPYVLDSILETNNYSSNIDIADFFNNQCTEYITNSQAAEAKATAEQALALPNIGSNQKADLYNKLCISYLLLNDPSNAEKAAKLGLHFALLEPRNDLLFKLFNNLCSTCLKQIDYLSVIKAAVAGMQQIPSITQEQYNQLWLQANSVTFAFCEQKIQSDHIAASMLIQKTTFLSNTEKADFCNQLCSQYITQKKWTDAEKIIQYAFSLSNLNNNHLIQLYYNLSIIYFIKDDHKTAISITNKALILPSLTATEFQIAFYNKNLIITYIFSKYNSLASQYFNEKNYYKAIKAAEDGLKYSDLSSYQKNALILIINKSNSMLQCIPKTQLQPQVAPNKDPNDNIQFYINLCSKYTKEGNISKAINAIQAGLALPNITNQEKYTLLQTMGQAASSLNKS